MSIHDAISAEVNAACRSYRGILLRGIPVFLRDTGCDDDAAVVEKFFARFGSGTLSEMVDSASPALWLNAQHIYSRGAAPKSDIHAYVLQFLVASFDSFWRLLRPGDSLNLDEVGDKDICLPNLQRRIRARSITLARLEDACAIEEEGRLIALNRSANCSPLSCRCIAHSGALAIGEVSPDLFDERSFHAMKDHDIDLDQFAGGLSAALLMIREVMPTVAHLIERRIRWYVPLKAPPNVHRSHTSSSLPGAIFLSLAQNAVTTADAIVHENAHNHLTEVDKVCGLVVGDDPEVHYSPWRPDSRPIRGLLHGLFAFASVSGFLSSVEERLNGDEQERIRARRRLIAHRLRLALKQVDRTCLTPFSRALIERIDDFSADLGAELLLDHQDLPVPIREHMAAWQQRYPEYRLQS